MLRRSLALSGLASVLPAACVLTACQSTDPAQYAQTAAALDGVARVDLSSRTWKRITAPHPLLDHAATALDASRILVTGGALRDGQYIETTDAAYVFEATGETWTPVGPMTGTRAGHTAFLDGSRVVVAGGYSQGSGGFGFLSDIDVFDESSSAWTRGEEFLTLARSGHTLAQRSDGTVFAIGGEGFDGMSEAVDIFETTWNEGPPLPEARVRHTSVALPNGTIVVTGGDGASYVPSSTNFVLTDPEDTWTADTSLAQARAAHTATVLADGRVLVAGGFDASYATLGSVEIISYAPVPGGASLSVATGPSMHEARGNHAAALLPDGRVLVVGGRGNYGKLASTEVYDPQTNEWSPGPKLNTARSHHVMLVLSNRVVVIGGEDDAWNAIASVEVLELGKENGEACSSDGECSSGHCVDGVCCDTACEGACVACTAALKGSGADGVCGGVVDGTNPRSACEGGEVCQAGVCVAPSACAGQPDGTECGAGKVCENGACVDAPTECEGQANGTICSIGDGCTMGICQQGSCVETHKLDGTRCEGGICVAGECKADPHVAPTTGAGGSGGSATGGSGSDDGTGPGNGSGSASDDGGGCRIARGSESSSPVALSAALLTGLALLRRRSASRARA